MTTLINSYGFSFILLFVFGSNNISDLWQYIWLLTLAAVCH